MEFFSHPTGTAGDKISKQPLPLEVSAAVTVMGQAKRPGVKTSSGVPAQKGEQSPFLGVAPSVENKGTVSPTSKEEPVPVKKNKSSAVAVTRKPTVTKIPSGTPVEATPSGKGKKRLIISGVITFLFLGGLAYWYFFWLPQRVAVAPLPAPERGDRNTFSDRVDAFVTWLTAAVGQFNALVVNVAANATSAFKNRNGTSMVFMPVPASLRRRRRQYTNV